MNATSGSTKKRAHHFKTDAEWLKDVEQTAKAVRRQNECGSNSAVELAPSEVLELVRLSRLAPEPDGDVATLKRLFAAECDDTDRLLGRLGLGDKASIAEQYRSEGGFLRGGKIENAIREKLAIEPAVWQPIETAPKDGKRVFVSCPVHQAVDMVAAFWNDDKQAWITTPGLYPCRPSHWMRPAQPPTKGENGNG